MTEKTTYLVTELAGTHVAGRRVQAGDSLELTADEALSEELAGTIVRAADGAGEATDEQPALPAVEADEAGNEPRRSKRR